MLTGRHLAGIGMLAGIVLPSMYLYWTFQRFSDTENRVARLRHALVLVYELEDSLGEMPEPTSASQESSVTTSKDDSKHKLQQDFILALAHHDTGTVVPVVDSSGSWLCGGRTNRNRNAALFVSLAGVQIDPGEVLMVGETVRLVNLKNNAARAVSLEDCVIIAWDGTISTVTDSENPSYAREILLDVN